MIGCRLLSCPHRYNGREYLKTIEESDMQWQHRKETSRRERNTPGAAPSSPTRAAIHNGTFHSTGSMAFGGGGVPASPSLHRQTSSRSGNGSLIGSPSPRTKGSSGLGSSGGSSGGSGWGSGPVNLSASGSSKAGIGRTGSASSNSSMLSAGGGPVVDSRGGAATGQHAGGGGGEGARAAGAAGGAGAGAGGEGGRDPAAKSLPSTPQKNPLLSRSFTPSPTSKGSKHASRIPSTFASTGGSQ